MRTEQEIISGPLAMRIIAGIMSLLGIAVMLHGSYQVLSGQREFSWFGLIMGIGGLWGLYLFGSFAIRGVLPLKFEQRDEA